MAQSIRSQTAPPRPVTLSRQYDLRLQWKAGYTGAYAAREFSGAKQPQEDLDGRLAVHRGRS
jgi:hypothetical protein